MKKFVFIYNSGDEHTEENYKIWMKWFDANKDKFIDSGNPFGPGKEVMNGMVKDLTPEVSPANGYSILNAANLEEAIEIAKNCPTKVGLRVYEAVSM